MEGTSRATTSSIIAKVWVPEEFAESELEVCTIFHAKDPISNSG